MSATVQGMTTALVLGILQPVPGRTRDVGDEAIPMGKDWHCLLLFQSLLEPKHQELLLPSHTGSNCSSLSRQFAIVQYEIGRWWHGRRCRNTPLRWPCSNEDSGGKGKAKGSCLVCWCPRPALDAQTSKQDSWTSIGRNIWWFCFLRQGTSFSGCPASFQEWCCMSPWLPWYRRLLCSRLIIIDIWIKNPPFVTLPIPLLFDSSVHI